MEPILTLDLADSPAKLRIVSTDGDQIKVWSETTIDLTPKVSDSEHSSETKHSSETNNQTEADNTELDQVNNNQAEALSNNSNNSSQNIEDSTKDNFVSELSSAIEKLDPIWSSSVILVAPKSYHSLNLELPFKDDKSVSKVLALETQDRLPFNLEEFFVEHKVLSQRPDNQFDVHVALTLKEEIQSIIQKCQLAGIDPVAISTVPSLLEAIVLENPSYFSSSSVFLALHGEDAYLAFRIQGEFKTDRVFKYKNLNLSEVASEVRRSIGAVEARYEISLDEVWVYKNQTENSDNKDQIELDELINKLKETLTTAVKSFDEIKSNKTDLADWFLPFYQDSKGPRLFVNFRSGQFSQTMRWGELWKITKSSVPYLIVLIFAVIAIMSAIFMIREREIASLQQGVIAKIQPLLGDNKLLPGQIVKSIQIANDTIERQLKDLGSPSKFSPLDVLTEVTKDFSSIKDVTITSVSIRGTQLTVSGTSTNYENVDAIERVLQSKRTLYCRPTKQVSGSSVRQFTFTVTLCD